MAHPAQLLPLLAMGLLLVWQARRLYLGARRRSDARAAFFDACRPLLSDTLTRVEPDGFQRLAGVYGGARFDLRVIPDTLSTRKLPTLWLLATLAEPLPLRSTWSLMLRPRGSETFSSFGRLPRLLPPQPDLPEDSAVRTDAASGAAPHALASTVERLGGDCLKEVVLSPKGLRLTWLLEEADRARYLAFRDAEMGLVPLAPETLSPLLDALLDLRGRIVSGRIRA